MDYKQKLPKEVEKKLNNYIQRIEKIKWFQPAKNLKKANIEKQVKVILKAFGVEAKIEYKQLRNQKAWNAAQDAARDVAWGAARNAAWNAARDAAWGAARDAAWDAARDAAWGAAWDAAYGVNDILVSDLKEYKKKYPNGNFINLIPLWEIGLYPVGLINGKFIIYIPSCKIDFPNIA